MKNSKYVQLDKNVLLEYVYDSDNLISEPYKIINDIRIKANSYIAGDQSVSLNTQQYQLFKVDPVTNRYGIVNSTNYNFLNIKDYGSGIPIQHDTLKIHFPINYTFGEYIGCHIRYYAFDYNNQKTYDLSNFYFDMTDPTTSNLIDYNNPYIYFNEKMWGKNLTLLLPSIAVLSNQRDSGKAKLNSINYNLTNGIGLSQNSPIFIDFEFITSKQTINGITTYTCQAPYSTSFPLNPEYENLSLFIGESQNGDFFEIYGTYNGTIAGFKQFIDNAKQFGNNYVVKYDVTTIEQNVRGKTSTFYVDKNFNEKIEYRPIIKYSTTTSILDVQMNVIDVNDDSQIIKRASYGMMQDQTSKYSLSLSKINLADANKPKIYNVISPIGPGALNGDTINVGANTVSIEPIKVPYPVLVDKFNIICKSDNVKVGSNVFFGKGLLKVLLYPFDNVISFKIAEYINDNTIQYLNMSSMGSIKFIVKDSISGIECQLYYNANVINLEIGFVQFYISTNNMAEIRKIYERGNNIFYITSTVNNITSVVYSGLFNIYDTTTNIDDINDQSDKATDDLSNSTQGDEELVIIQDQTDALRGTAIVTRRVTTGNANVIASNIDISKLNTSASSTLIKKLPE